MKKLFYVTAFFFFFCLAWSQAVNFDSNFGNNGIVPTPCTVEIMKTIIAPDGKLLSMGYHYKNNSSLTYDWALARYNMDGSPDNSFGINGLVLNADIYSGMGYAIAIQPDNKILVAGNKYYDHIEIAPDRWASVDKSFIARYDSNGDPDLTFGDNGIIIMDFNVRSSTFSSLALLENNQMILGGHVGSTTILLKLNPDGSVDNSFGNSGLVVFDDPDFMFLMYSFELLEDGNLLCYGGEYLGDDSYFLEPVTRVAILKLNTNGELVSSFGDNGKVLIDNEFSVGMHYCSKSIEMENHQILLGGYMQNSFLLKLHPDGSLDDSFGSQGIVTHSYPFVDMAVWENGQIFVAGSKEMNPYDWGYSVCRFNVTGTIDETFNTTGYFDYNPSAGKDYLHCIIIQPDGKLLLSGSSHTTGPADFTLVRLVTDDTPNQNEDIRIETDIKIYPNPFQEVINIKSSGETLSQLIIYDIVGNTVLSESCNTNEISISLNLPKGIYICTVVTSNGNRYSRKIVKQ
jgi:uncharacterized delta-60 repeat protein